MHLRRETDPQEAIHRGLTRRQSIVRLLTASTVGALAFLTYRVPITAVRQGSSPFRIFRELMQSVALYLSLVYGLFPKGSLRFLLLSFGITILWGSAIDIVYHQGLSLSGGVESTRSLADSKFSAWFLNGENWHAEHHAYPGIPGCNLGKLSAIIRPSLEAQGAKYVEGYCKAFIRGLVVSPFFLPPREVTLTGPPTPPV